MLNNRSAKLESCGTPTVITWPHKKTSQETYQFCRIRGRGVELWGKPSTENDFCQINGGVGGGVVNIHKT